MYKLCKTEQSAERQRRIEEGLLDMLQERRYEDISVSELCDRLQIPRKAFYRYFSGKDGALYSLIDHTLTDYMDYAARENLDGREEPLEYMEEVCRYWMNCGPLLEALDRNNMSGVMIQRAVARAWELDSYPHFLRTAEKQLQEYGALFATCGIVTMMVQWHRDNYAQSLQQMAQLLVRLLGQPLFNMGRTE